MAGLVKKKILVVCGPTASGKTELALQLAKAFSGELVGADSMQIYRGLTIGTAALRPEETQGIPQHLVGFLPPESRFSVAEYASAANKTLRDITERNVLPVVCGGTGQYVQAIVEGLQFVEQPQNQEYMRFLEQEWNNLGAGKMLQSLAQVDPDCAVKLHENDKKRILRALEQYKQTGKTLRQRNQDSRIGAPAYNILCLGFAFENRDVLYARINKRVDAMLQAGLLQEAQMVYQNKERYTTAVQAIGYKEFFPFFEKQTTLEECVEKLKQATRNYAKRQVTWFKKMQGIHWVNPEETDFIAKNVNLCKEFMR